MTKRKEMSREEGREEESSRQERRSKRRHEVGSTSLPMVNPNPNRLLKDAIRVKLFNEKFFKREVLEYKHVDFENLVALHEKQNVDVANYISCHNWSDFVQIHRPINKTLIRILISNLDESTMLSWIGKVRVDLSIEAWCDVFEMEIISDEEEAAVMTLSKEELFFRLTGINNLGLAPFIKINQLHQEANVKLAAHIVMNALVPKKGSKEQIKLAEGRLLYAMIYGKKINLAQMIVERLRSALGRKSIPICYGMHLMEMMARAGVDMHCAGEDETHFDSVIDHHTLRRLGYKCQHGSWNYVGKRQDQAQAQAEEEGREEEEEEEEEEGGEPVAEEAPQPSQPQTTSSSRPRPRTTYTTSQASNLATKEDITYLQQFLFEQLRLFQATILSTLDKMDSRLQNLEDHILHHPQHSPHHSFPIPDPTDPKGKRPIPPSPLSVHSSPKSSHHSPPSSPHSSHKSKSSSSSSHLATTTRFKLASRKNTTTSPPVLSSTSFDSEATHSAPTSPTKPTSPSKPSSPMPHPQPPPPTTTSSLPTESSPSQATATYRRRKKLPVTRPKPLGHPYLLMPPASP